MKGSSGHISGLCPRLHTSLTGSSAPNPEESCLVQHEQQTRTVFGHTSYRQRKAPGESDETGPSPSAFGAGRDVRAALAGLLRLPAPAQPRQPQATLPRRPGPPGPRETPQPPRRDADGYLELLVLALIQQLFETKGTFCHHGHGHLPGRSRRHTFPLARSPNCPPERRAVMT